MNNENIPAVLFDGYAVYEALSPSARRRTSTENVSDVLDAVVALLRGQQQAKDTPEVLRLTV